MAPRSKSLKLLLATLALSLALSIPASAGQFVILFDDLFKTTTGTVNYDGLGGPLVGLDIPFTFIIGELGQVPIPGAIACNACVLNFTTGANTTEVAGSSYVWAGNADPLAFVISGMIFADMAPTVLLSGPINGATFNNSTGQFTAAVGGTDIKDPRILAFFFGGPAPADFVYTNTDINAVGVSFDLAGGFKAVVNNADVTNTNAPEPGSALLLLLGLGSLAVSRRRRS